MAGLQDVLIRFGLQDDVSRGAKGIQDSITGMGRTSTGVIDGLANSFSMLDSAMMGAMGAMSGKSLMDLTIGNASKAETGKVLLKNILDDAESNFDKMYTHLDNLTNESLVSLNQMMPAMANFKSATGATDAELENASNTMANFGQYVLAITGSEAKAETAMNDLSKGIKGQFAALDQYKLSEEALMNTGLWSGKEDDVEGYMKAVDQVIGKTDELMETNEGLDAKLQKAFSSEGKAIGNDLLPGLKEAKKAFLEWNESLDGKPAEYIILATSAVSGFATAMGTLGTTINGIKQLQDAWTVLKTKIFEATEAEKVFTETQDMGGVIPKKNNTKTNAPKDNRSFKEKNIDNLKDVGTSTIKAAAQIASAMLLVTEAIILIQMPMAALAGVGTFYNAIEPQVKKGVEGINTIAGIMAMLLPPIIALMIVMQKFDVSMETIKSSLKGAATGIAVGILLVTEAIILMVAPLTGLAIVGTVYSALGESNVNNGIKGIQAVNNALTALTPWIGIFAITILACLTPISAAVIAIAGASGIALGILLVTEAIMGMSVPLAAISELGRTFSTDLASINKGTDAIKKASEALKSVSDACKSLASISKSDLETYITSGFKSSIEKLRELTSDEGIVESLKTFAKEFNEQTKGIVQVDMSGVNAIKSAAEAVKSINSVFKEVKETISNLDTGNSSGATTKATAEENRKNGGYFKNALSQIKDAATQIGEFNQELSSINLPEVDTGKLEALVSTANTVTKIKDTVNKVKNAIQGIGQLGVTQAASNGGGLGKFLSESFGGNNSIRQSLQQLLDALDDLIWFNQQVQTKTANLGENNSATTVDNTSKIVSGISNTIKQISTTISNSISTMSTKGKDIGEAIKKGIKTGIGNISSSITPALNTAMKGLSSAAKTGGENVGKNLVDGFKTQSKNLTQSTKDEINHALTALDNAKQEFYNRGAELGRQLTLGFESTDGIDRGSPGKVARFTADEMNYTRDALLVGETKLYIAAQRVGRAVVQGFGDPGLTIKNRLSNIMGNDGFNTELKTSADIANIKRIGASFTPHNTQVHTTTLHIHEGAVKLDARNLTTKESKQVMTNALEGLGEVEGVLTKKSEPTTTFTTNTEKNTIGSA